MSDSKVILYGKNRRQKPIDFRVPGGTIRIERAPYGTIVVKIVAEAGRIEVPVPRNAWTTEVRLVREEE